MHATNSHLTGRYSWCIVGSVDGDTKQRNLGNHAGASYCISASLVHLSDTTVSNQRVRKVSTYHSPTIERRRGNLIELLRDAANNIPRGGLPFSRTEEISTVKDRRVPELLASTFFQQTCNVGINLVRHSDTMLSGCSALKIASSLHFINVGYSEAVVIFLIHNQLAGGDRHVIINKIDGAVMGLDVSGTNLRDIYRIARVLQHRLKASISDVR